MEHFCSQTYRSAKREWCYIKGGDISGVALYQGWHYIKGGTISRLAIYQGWRYIKGGTI